MRLSYDLRYNVAYIRLLEKTADVETLRISDSVNIDIAPDGTLYGIELLNANEQLRGAGEPILEVINEARQQRQTVALG